MTDEERQRKSTERKKRWRGVMYGGGTPPAVHGGAPEWVPANAKIYIDLVNNRAWTESGGIVAIDTLLGTDPNTVNGWGTSIYDPSRLIADGYLTAPDSPEPDFPALIGGALTRVLDSATVVVRTKRTTDNAFTYTPLVLLSADGNDAVEIDAQGDGPVRASSYNGPLSLLTSSAINTGNGAINVVAMTITPSRLDMAANGSSAVTGSIGGDDRPSGNLFVASAVDPNAQNALQSITIYDALPDTTGLSALSAV